MMGLLTSVEVSAPANEGTSLRSNTKEVFRAFDSCDPAARAPTPLPPLFLGDFAEGDQGDPLPLSINASTDKTMLSNSRSSSVLPTSSSRHTIIKALGADGRFDGSTEYALLSDSTDGTSVTALQQDQFPTHLDKERLLGKVEGIQLAYQKAGTKISLATCYELCGVPYHGGFQSIKTDEHTKPEITPPKTPYTERPYSASPLLSGAPDTASELETPIKGKQKPGDSPLSDCPSDLSDWDVSKVRPECA
jgi:hypothetical protein